MSSMSVTNELACAK